MDLTTVNENAMTVNTDEFIDYEVSQSDIVIPKILLMQPISEMVSQEKAKYGDFVDSLTSQVIGNGTDGINVIPVAFKKYHLIMTKQSDGKFKFTRFDPIRTLMDEQKPYLDTEGGHAIERKLIRDFYVLIPSISALPFSLQFKGMSSRAGAAFYTTAFATARASRLMPFATMFTITAKKTKNEKGNFAILDSKPMRRTTAEEFSNAKVWFNTINSMKVEELVSGESQEEETTAPCYPTENIAF